MDSLAIFTKISQENTPPNVRVLYMDASDSCGIANYDTDRMTVPKPDSMENLLIYLHECAHFFLHEDDETTPYYLKEFQAETWALKKMEMAGLTLPDELILNSKKLIANNIRGAIKNGIRRLDRSAFEFASSCFHDFEHQDFIDSLTFF